MGWTGSEIERAYRESPPAMKAFIGALMEYQGEWLGTKELSEPVSEAIGKNYRWQEMAGMLGAFGRRVKNRYDKGDRWFFDVRRDHENSRWVYRVSPELAEFLKTVIAEDN